MVCVIVSSCVFETDIVMFVWEIECVFSREIVCVFVRDSVFVCVK